MRCFRLFYHHTVCDNKDNIEAVDNMDHDNGKDPDNDKTEEEMSESGETTSSTTESDVSDVEMDSNNEDPFAWDKQVKCSLAISRITIATEL